LRDSAPPGLYPLSLHDALPILATKARPIPDFIKAPRTSIKANCIIIRAVRTAIKALETVHKAAIIGTRIGARTPRIAASAVSNGIRTGSTAWTRFPSVVAHVRNAQRITGKYGWIACSAAVRTFLTMSARVARVITTWRSASRPSAVWRNRRNAPVAAPKDPARPRPCRFISWKIIFPMVPRSFKKAIIARHAWPAPRNHPVIRWTLAMRLINAAARLPAAPIPPVKLLRAFRDAAPNRTTAAATGASQAPTRRTKMADWWREPLKNPNAWGWNALARRVATLPLGCSIRANPLDIESMIGRTVVNALRKAGRRPLLALSINRSIEGPRIRRNCLSIMALD